MPTSPSQVEIINLALSHIAQKPIVAITEASPSAVAALRVWDLSLRDALRTGAPGFATAVVALALVATYTPLHWTYAYAYPANCLAMLKVYTEGTGDPARGEEFRELYDSVGNVKVIVSNVEDAYGEYVYLISDTTLFDASFVTAMAYRLAANLAIPLVGDKTLAESMDKKFITAASECARLDSYEQNKPAQQKSKFLDAR